MWRLETKSEAGAAEAEVVGFARDDIAGVDKDARVRVEANFKAAAEVAESLVDGFPLISAAAEHIGREAAVGDGEPDNETAGDVIDELAFGIFAPGIGADTDVFGEEQVYTGASAESSIVADSGGTDFVDGLFAEGEGAEGVDRQFLVPVHRFGFIGDDHGGRFRRCLDEGGVVRGGGGGGGGGWFHDGCCCLSIGGANYCREHGR